MKMMFYSHSNKTHFHKKGVALSLVLKAKCTLELRNGVLLAWTLCLGFVDQSITVVNETFKAIAIFRVQNKD